MTKNLVIVESPAKARTIGKILGDAYAVKASMGHVRDLPVRSLGVAVERGFEPRYEVTPDRKKTVQELQAAARSCSEIYLAPDPDREGEAIAWHLKTLLEATAPKARFHRVVYHEITPRAVREAFAQPGDINMKRVEAQQARRVLDRLVGYKVSPLLWGRFQRNLSAGRVQTVALRLVVEREEAIRQFVPEPYWLIGAEVCKQVSTKDPFTIRLVRIHGEKADIRSADQAAAIRADLERSTLRVRGVEVKETQRRAAPPFTTSTMQQAASRRFGFSPSRTMRIAQTLYEGVDLGEGPIGLITYMRTDSVAVAREAQEQARSLIVERFGADFLPERPPVYRNRQDAQMAHEAIRPTDVTRTPEDLRKRLKPDEWKLYTLIWQRFVASQMAPARFEQRSVEIETEVPEGERSPYLFRVSATRVLFPGFRAVYDEDNGPREDRPENAGEKSALAEEPEVESLPLLEAGERLDVLRWLEERKETQPPPRYTEATLIKALEENGVGRPSTYAQILTTLYDRRYVQREASKRTLAPTPLGEKVYAHLIGALSELFDVGFTAAMEEKLDAIEEGQVGWRDMLDDFYQRLQGWLAAAKGPPAEVEHVRQILDQLAQVQQWQELPAAEGRRRKSDEQFIASIRKQMEEGRAISRRQLEALIRLAVRYRDQIPELEPTLRALGQEAHLEVPASTPPDERTLRKLELLKAVRTDPPVKRRGRTYDDAAFLSSLAAQVARGRVLSPAQVAVLDRLLLKYAEQIPNFSSERQSLGLGEAATAASASAADSDLAAIIERLSHSTTWKPPEDRKGKTYDDRLFFESLARQFRERGRLTPRQVSALKRLARSYEKASPAGETKSEDKQ